ncbi:MAG: YciI family protein [Pyrinomonadaceae bacterium]
MKKFLAFSIAVLSFVTTPAAARAQEKQQPPQFKMLEFHMALLKRGPKWSTGGMTKEVQSAHVANVMSLLDSGKAVIAGPLSDDGDIVGVYILRAKSAEEAKAWAESDPAVKAGNLVAEMHPWWSEDVMKKPSSPIKMTTAYLGLLTRGTKWTPEKTPATEELQKAHRANINRLAETKKLVVAGPFGDNGTLRGIFVFKVATLEEAKELAETDPAVKAGRLAIEMHPWLVPEGVLP